MKEEIKNKYFVERVTNEDWIGFDSYVLSLIDAINNGAKFIGLIGDYGSGKSTLISKLRKTDEKLYNVININLWNCNALNDEENDNVDIHRIFLHQLIDNIKIDNKDYYKKKINKNYSFFDILLKKTSFIFIFVFVLLVFYVISILDKLGFYHLFKPDSFWYYLWYLMLAVYTIVIIFILKPIFSFNKSTTVRNIDENDTRDLYNEILKEYFEVESNKDKILIISLEELDRYDNLNTILKYLKEFYKFYKEPSINLGGKKLIDSKNGNNIVFIISLKSVNQLCGDIQKDTIIETKKIYEKIFDFILNLKQVNIHDYDAILESLVKSKEIQMPKNVNLSPENIDKWRYLYKGKNVKIRDVKHRYNFAIATYYSVMYSELDNPDFSKCLYLSYLEDEYNELYESLILNDLIGEILLCYTNNNDITDLISNVIKSNNEDTVKEYVNVLLEGLDNKYISFDYNYYCYKLPKNIKPYNAFEYVLYNVIFYGEDDNNLKSALLNLSNEQICKILSKRANLSFIPLVLFKYPRLFIIVYEKEHEAYFNTITKRINLIVNFELFKNFISSAKKIKKYYKKILTEYFEFYLPKIIELEEDNKIILLRKNITYELGKDSIVVKTLFLNSEHLITFDEMKNIDDIKTILDLTDLNNINDNYIDSLIRYLKNKIIAKNKMILVLNILSKNNNISNETFEKIIDSINLNEYEFTESEYIKLFNISKSKINFNNVDNFNNFLNSINYYCEKFDKHYLNILKNTDLNITIKKYVKILNKMEKIYTESIEFLNSYNTIFSFSKIIREEFYKKKYYKYYVISSTLDEKIYEIEEKKKNILKNYYLQYFEDKKDWQYKVGPNMADFLYHNVNMKKLDANRLKIFVLYPQRRDIIDAVLDTRDKTFINKYLSKIDKFVSSDKLYSYKKIGYYIRNGNYLSENARKNLRYLAGKNKKLLLYLDGRRKILKD